MPVGRRAEKDDFAHSFQLFRNRQTDEASLSSIADWKAVVNTVDV
jgi:hypothetical protein